LLEESVVKVSQNNAKTWWSDKRKLLFEWFGWIDVIEVEDCRCFEDVAKYAVRKWKSVCVWLKKTW
jgi:hypothetical protein